MRQRGSERSLGDYAGSYRIAVLIYRARSSGRLRCFPFSPFLSFPG